MSEIVNKQKGDNNTQIGEQTNIDNKITVINNGLSPSEASELAIKLFYDNFPKLQRIAEETVNSRVNEFCNELLNGFIKKGIVDFDVFMEPDFQYALLESQKCYARYGEKEKLEILTSLIHNRVEHSNDSVFKITVDKAISTIGMLTAKQLDHLSLLFILTRVKLNYIKNVDNLALNLDELNRIFSNASIDDSPYLLMHGCLQLELPDLTSILANAYSLPKQEVERVMPKRFSEFVGDYSTSPVGTILGIINAENKTKYRFDPKIWVHD